MSKKRYDAVIISENATFRQRYFPDIGDDLWNDWRWQLRNRLRDREGLSRLFRLTETERAAVTRRAGPLPAGVTPYYASLIPPDQPEDPLRRTMVPRLDEFNAQPWERADPLGEEEHSPLPGLVHTYPHKVLFLATDFCATYCRYCTRSRMVGGGEFLPDKSMWEDALAYIRAHPEIHDVLLSGGDPLILADDRLEWLLTRLRAIPHVEIIRIGSKLPAVLPQRITPELAALLGRHAPLWLSLHFTHPRELTPECALACGRLADAGIPLMAQTVLLAGVNDDEEILADLFQGLLRLRVKPYYLHQCDPVAGSSHFKTSVQHGLRLLSGLHGRLTGYAIPHYMIDAPGGGGKVPVAPNHVVGREGDDLLLRNYRGEIYRYPDPEGR
jgi:lysine 2,3-aminomutase